MTLTDTQLEAIDKAAKILAAAGLSFSDLSDSNLPNLGLNPFDLPVSDELSNGSSLSAPFSLYEPPRARIFTLDELDDRVCDSCLN